MSGTRVLVGTRKGAFILTSDGAREEWTVDGPHFPGAEIYHLKGSPLDPQRVYASQSSGWFGQVIHRSDDGGATWEVVDNDFTYDGVPGQHQWYDGSLRPWEFTRVWHLEPSVHDLDTVYAGVEDAALFKSTDGARTWTELSGLRRARHRPAVAARRRRDVPAHHHRAPDRPAAALRRHLGGRRLPHRRRWSDLAADQQGPALRRDPRRGLRGRALRAPPRPAPEQPRRALHAEALGRHAQQGRRRQLARGQRQPADRLRLRHLGARPRAGDHLRRPDRERHPPRPTGGQAARLSQPHRRRASGRR